MAHKKSAGTTKNGRDSGPRYLGVKLYAGERAKAGSIIVRQEGGTIIAGRNTDMGRDYTIYALKEGTVRFGKKRKLGFNNRIISKKVAHVE